MDTKDVSRRHFLKQSLGTVAGVAAGLGTLRRISAQPQANDLIRVGCVGFHGRGMSHVRAFANMKGVRVVALCDVDERVWGRGLKVVEKAEIKKAGGDPKAKVEMPKTCFDIRKMLEDKSIDVISIATPDHWHALAAVWGCQAGKHVYVEKPVSHNVSEGRRIVEASREHDRIVQTGTQSRSSGGVRKAMALLHAGAIGDVYMARALCYKPRGSIGFQKPSDPPNGLHFDLWLGPAPEQPYHANLVHYNWHWFWDFGTTDMGNQGVHQMDIARWGLNKELPVKVNGVGGRYGYKDQAETPNTQVSTFTYEDGAQLVFEVRGHYTNDEAGVRIGNLFYGSKGYMVLRGGSYKIYMGRKGEPLKETPEVDPNLIKGSDHFGNFIEAVRNNKRELLNADILEGHLSSALCHLGNVSYRLGRGLTFDPKTETFGDDKEANAYLTRDYRKPFVVPEKV